MSHPYPKPILPKWPAPILPAPTTHIGFFTSSFDSDGRSKLWGSDEFLAECDWCIANQFPGTHEARSLQFFADHIRAVTGELWQVQDAPGLDVQQAASVYAGDAFARMIGSGTTNFASAMHANIGSGPPTAILGGAFSNDNYLNGVVSFHGITSDEVLALLQNAATRYIRAGGISE